MNPLERNRKIKFKVWDIHSKCFMEIFTDNGGNALQHKLPLEEAKLKYERDESKGSPYPKATLSHILSCPDFYVALQFTETLDMDGKEIYDGDIVTHDSGRISNGKCGEVIWALGSWMVIDNEGCLDFDVFNNGQHLKVVGNILENPELMDEESENKL